MKQMAISWSLRKSFSREYSDLQLAIGPWSGVYRGQHLVSLRLVASAQTIVESSLLRGSKTASDTDERFKVRSCLWRDSSLSSSCESTIG